MEIDWIISDTHFLHDNIKEYCNRPDNWQDLIILNWNKLIKPEDTVLHLGDFALGHRKDIKNIREKLNGNIIMVLGNHDRQSKEFYNSIGITIISKFVYNNILFSHRPGKIKPPDIIYNIHGHTHTNENLDEFHLNICVEKTDYSPKNFKELLGGLNVRMGL